MSAVTTYSTRVKSEGYIWLHTSALFHPALVGCMCLIGLYPHCCNSTTSVVSEFDHWARYLYVLIRCTTGQYRIYCPGGIALIYVIGGTKIYIATQSLRLY